MGSETEVAIVSAVRTPIGSFLGMSREHNGTDPKPSKPDYLTALEKQFETMESELAPIHCFGRMLEFRIGMRDNVKLHTRVYFPEGEGPWPVILERSPYPQMRPMLELIGKQFTKYGYAFVSQDCRGKGLSEGEWEPFANERHDGLDTIGWIVGQPWMNRNMAMYGHSYGGFEQWILADSMPPEVKTLFIGVFGTERYRQMYMNGMFRHEIYTSWAIENAGLTVQEPLGDLYRKALRYRPHMVMDVGLLGRELPWYRDWVTNVSGESDYWQSGLWSDLRAIPAHIRVPVFLVGGWYDHHLDGMVCAYRNLREEVREKSRFVIGPWIHTLQPAGDLVYPGNEFSALREALQWFDHHLKGLEYGKSTGCAETYVIREGVWKDWQGWREGGHQASLNLSTKRSDLKRAMSLSFADQESGVVSFDYDPDDPVATKGGEALLAWISPGFGGCAPGPVFQDELGARPDVISFVSGALIEELRISGPVRVSLSVSSDAEDTSFAVKLSEITPDGKTFNIRDGITSLAYRNRKPHTHRYVPGEVVELEIELWPIAWTIREGSRLRLDISSSNFPAYHIHPNVEGSWAEQGTTRVARQNIHMGPGYHSRLIIPVGEAGDSPSTITS